MAYIAPADFRTGTLTWYTRQFPLTTSEAPDADLTAAIAAWSAWFDLQTGDHFEADTDPLDLDGGGGPRLIVPKRIRSVTAVSLRDRLGVLTAQDAADFRVKQSLVNGIRQEHDLDYIEVIPGQVLTNGLTYWPKGPQTVRVAGTFSWAAVPERVKRAIAILVYDQFKPLNDNLRVTERWQVNDIVYDRATTEPSGLPEVDRIVLEFTRTRIPAV